MLDLPASVEKVVRHLREDILRGRLRAGERLPSERELAERVGVNRGAVREARRALAQLGLLEIGPGGARVAPLGEASLGVVEHLLELDALPDPAMVSQIFEAAATIFAGASLLFMERASDAQVASARALLDRLQLPELPDPQRHELMHDLFHQVVEGSGNFVLGLIHQNLKLQFYEQIRELNELSSFAPQTRTFPVVRSFDAALAARDGESASRMIRQLFSIHRDQVIASLEEARAQGTRAQTTDREQPPASSVFESLRLETRPSELE